MFDNLTEKLQQTFKKLSGKGKLSEHDVDEAMRELRLALLDADVHFKVVRSFISKVKELCVGEEVLSSLSPSQQVIKIVHQQLTALMGSTHGDLVSSSKIPTVIMLVGLQGAGKTTLAGKLSVWLQEKRQHTTMLVGADPYRPAASEQLATIAKQAKASFFPCGEDPVKSTKEALSAARTEGATAMIVDTAGRTQTDEDLMAEIASIKKAVSPDEILLVADATTGQEAVSVAKAFHKALKLTGICLTKMDGDARGGAALSMMSESTVPIKLIGVGEKLSQLEPFHPDRMASRILGMGDVLTLIDKAQDVFDEREAKRLEKRLKRAELDLEDFLSQIKKLQGMGGIREVMSLVPGMPKGMAGNVDETEIRRIEAIILSMTPGERRNPRLIDGSRRRRIARGSGTHVSDVNRLLHDFRKMKKMMRGLKGKRGMKGIPFPLG